MNNQIFAFIWSIVLVILLEPLVLMWFKRRNLSQAIREEGPKSHVEAKKGTATMGGLVMIIASTIITLIFSSRSLAIIIALVSLWGFGLIGFFDDFLKVVNKRNLGFNEKQKMAGQILFAVILAIFGAKISPFGTTLFIPFTDTYLNLGWFYYPFVVFAVVAVVNGVNLTDGLDGLNASVTTVVSIGFLTVIAFNGEKFDFTYDINVMIYTIAGACVGFLYYNHHPAKMFMGDIGSLALGGAISAFAVLTGYVLLLPIIGIIYVIEVVSDIIQVCHYKRTKKRFFRMAPIHHHFELGGWSENKVVFVFSFVSLLAAAIGVFSAI